MELAGLLSSFSFEVFFKSFYLPKSVSFMLSLTLISKTVMFGLKFDNFANMNSALLKLGVNIYFSVLIC